MTLLVGLFCQAAEPSPEQVAVPELVTPVRPVLSEMDPACSSTVSVHKGTGFQPPCDGFFVVEPRARWFGEMVLYADGVDHIRVLQIAADRHAWIEAESRRDYWKAVADHRIDDAPVSPAVVYGCGVGTGLLVALGAAEILHLSLTSP